MIRSPESNSIRAKTVVLRIATKHETYFCISLVLLLILILLLLLLLLVMEQVLCVSLLLLCSAHMLWV